MLTASLARHVYDTVRTHLQAAQVEARLHGKEFTCLLSGGETEAQATMWGRDENYRGTVYIKVTELPAKTVEDGDRIELKDGNRWVTYRLKNSETVAGAVFKAEIESEYEG